MIKAWLVTFLIMSLFVIAYAVDLFAFLASDAVMYIAVFLVAATLIAARIILGSPLKQDDDDEKTDN